MAVLDHWEIDPNNETEIWQRLIGHDSEDRAETVLQVSVILDEIPHGFRALEIGCGVGRLIREIELRHHFDHPVEGCDSSLSLVTIGNSGYLDPPRIMLSDGLLLPYPDNSFDFVYSFTCFQHMRSLAMIHRNLTETKRILRPGAVCRIQTVIAKPDTSPRDFSSYDGRVMTSVEEFESMFRGAGLEVVKSETGLTHPEHVWVTGRKS